MRDACYSQKIRCDAAVLLQHLKPYWSRFKLSAKLRPVTFMRPMRTMKGYHHDRPTSPVYQNSVKKRRYCCSFCRNRTQVKKNHKFTVYIPVRYSVIIVNFRAFSVVNKAPTPRISPQNCQTDDGILATRSFAGSGTCISAEAPTSCCRVSRAYIHSRSSTTRHRNETTIQSMMSYHYGS